jgi:hypothetical protein
MIKIETEEQFRRLFEPLQIKIERFVWVNGATICTVIRDELIKVTGIDFTGISMADIYRWAINRWGRPVFSYTNQHELYMAWDKIKI